MSRRRYRKVIPKGVLLEQVTEPAEKEFKIILMAADSIIPINAGRRYLVQLLKGSKTQVMFRNHSDESEYYGLLSQYSLDEIQKRIDWLIVNDWLRLEQEWKTPHIVHSPQGWELVKQIWVEKLLELMRTSSEKFFKGITDINPQIKYLLLDTIAEKNIKEMVPILKEWQKSASRKLGAKIKFTLMKITQDRQTVSLFTVS